MGKEALHLLLVAGPSGSGKSTFIEELVDGRISHRIKGYLPPTVHNWTQTSVKQIAAGQSALPSTGGLIVHYDTMRPCQLRMDGYTSDNALTVLLSKAGRLTIITIKIPADRLRKQYERRKTWFTRWFRRSKMPLVEIYKSREAVEHWAQQWDAFIRSIGQQRRDVFLITVGPTDEHRAFQFINEEHPEEQGSPNTAGTAQYEDRDSAGVT